jgi:hypothetical protein
VPKIYQFPRYICQTLHLFTMFSSTLNNLKMFKNEISINDSLIKQITLLVRICVLEPMDMQSFQVQVCKTMNVMNYLHNASNYIVTCMCKHVEDISVWTMCLCATNKSLVDKYVQQFFLLSICINTFCELLKV